QLEGDRQFDVRVRLPQEYRNTLEAVPDVKVAGGTGGNAYIPLRELAKITLDTGASYIYHERSQRYIPVKFSVRGRDLGSTVAEAQERIAKTVQLPNGYQ
ncbi:UNVERIFIED_CONTAM: efflux RND transporter permease subunit, partial [Bacteroidetes bacterium 56_B9]